MNPSAPTDPGAPGRLRIAVLDSGINPAHRQVGPVVGGIRIGFVEGRVRFADDWNDGIGHGTAVAASISEGLPAGALALLSVRVFGRRLEARADVVAAGIRWATRRAVAICNLSAGVALGADPEGETELAEACREAATAGMIVIAPQASRGCELAPGAFRDQPAVVGVEADAGLERGQIRRRGAGLVAAPWARPMPPLPSERNFSGASLAVAAVTNHAARLVLAGETGVGVRLRAALLARAG